MQGNCAILMVDDDDLLFCVVGILIGYYVLFNVQTQVAADRY